MVDGNMTEDEEILAGENDKYNVKRCKDAAWRRWQREYVTALRERHNMQYKLTSIWETW